MEDDGHEQEDLLGVVSLLLGVIGPCLCRVYVCGVVGSSERGRSPSRSRMGSIAASTTGGLSSKRGLINGRSSRQPVHSALWIAADKLKAAWLALALAQYLSTPTPTPKQRHAPERPPAGS